MKALDSNVLLRYLVEDDPAQTRQAAKVIEDAARREEPLFLSLLVLCEVVWVLDRSYAQSRSAICGVLERLLDTDAFQIEREDLASRCVGEFRTGKAGFADFLIGAIAQKAGYERVYTFDKDLRGAPGFHVL
ncbi:MAG: type II toxin-antitoxin system VapC family toxin [Bryobacteraceae bacterium]